MLAQSNWGFWSLVMHDLLYMGIASFVRVDLGVSCSTNNMCNIR